MAKEWMMSKYYVIIIVIIMTKQVMLLVTSNVGSILLDHDCCCRVSVGEGWSRWECGGYWAKEKASPFQFLSGPPVKLLPSFSSFVY
jgi:hypothetical protein